MNEIYEKIALIMKDIFSYEVTDKTIFSDLDGWDSLTRVRFVVALENEFQIKVQESDLEMLDTVSNTASLIQSKQA